MYIVSCTVGTQNHKGILNMGQNPTVEGQSLSIEVHLFDFKDDIYGQEISVSFLKRIRDEQKFNSVDALKTQIAQDKLVAQQFFENQ